MTTLIAKTANLSMLMLGMLPLLALSLAHL
jgi:hypothetical protein